MGLAAPRKKTKISHDPNNTIWSRNDESFGRKILESQGWTPGSYLGAKNAAQADHFSAANASHVRVVLKDDNLGIGAKRTNSDMATFGIGALQDIYGRLNGKSEVVLAKEQASRADVGRKMYAEQRWGAARFVRGGFLVGDRIEAEAPRSLEEDSHIEQNKHPTRDNEGENVSDSEGAEQRQVSVRKDQRKRSRRSGVEESSNAASATGNDENMVVDTLRLEQTETKEERWKRRQERRQRKAEKAAHKAATKAAKAAQLAETNAGSGLLDTQSATEDSTSNTEPAQSSVNEDAVIKPPLAQSQPLNNRNAVRQRFIRQKRMASMDPVALREILMMKA